MTILKTQIGGKDERQIVAVYDQLSERRAELALIENYDRPIGAGI